MMVWEFIDDVGELMNDTGTRTILDLTGKTITLEVEPSALKQASFPELLP